MDEEVIALYARGLTVREIQAFLAEIYAVDVLPDLISTVTEAIVAEVSAWQSRSLDALYPVVFFDALRGKMRDEGVVRNKTVYVALAVLPDGTRDWARPVFHWRAAMPRAGARRPQEPNAPHTQKS